jgi:hypothetical protein
LLSNRLHLSFRRPPTVRNNALSPRLAFFVAPRGLSLRIIAKRQPSIKRKFKISQDCLTTLYFYDTEGILQKNCRRGILYINTVRAQIPNQNNIIFQGG